MKRGWFFYGVFFLIFTGVYAALIYSFELTFFQSLVSTLVLSFLSQYAFHHFVESKEN